MNAAVLAFSASDLFKAILEHLWESSLVGIAILGIIIACRKAPANLRQKLSWIGLLKFLIPAAGLAPLIRVLEKWTERITSHSPAALASGLPGYRFLTINPSYPIRYPEGLVYGMLGAWAIVTFLLVARCASKGSSFRKDILDRAQPTGQALSNRLAALAAKVGLNAAPRTIVPSESEGPGISGIIYPLLLIPRSLDEQLTTAEMDSILIHELIHLKRLDHLWGAIRTVFLAVFWHNPVVWLLCRSNALETEKSCDEEVIRITSAPGIYADGILKTMRLSLGLPVPGLTAAAGHSVTSRIKSILNPHPRKDSIPMKTIALSAACLIAVLSAFADTSPDNAPASKQANPNAETFDVTKLDVKPRVLGQERPVYPPAMHAQGVGAEVLVDFIVDPTGAVKNAYAVRSTCAVAAACADFEKSAVASVSQWKFTPGEIAGRKVFTHIQVPIVYTVTAGDTGSKPSN